MPPRGRAHHETDEETPVTDAAPAEAQAPDALEEAAPVEEATSEEAPVEDKTILVVAPSVPYVLTDDERLRVPNVFVAQVRQK